MKKFISLCIIAAMLTGLFSSCANPPGSKPSSDTLPQPGDQPETEKAVAEPDPVDLSGLTEEELGKIDDKLLKDIKTTASDSSITISVLLKRPMSTGEFNIAVDTQVKYNTEKREEIEEEINALKKQKENLKQIAMISSGNDNSVRIEEIDAKINDLNAEYEAHNPVYGRCVNQVIDANFRPVLDEFMNRHGLDSKGCFYLKAAMTIEEISTTPSKIIDFAKDEDVILISYPEKEYGEVVDCILSDGDTSQTPPVSDYEVNQIYNIIDGEIAANAGYTGSDRMECV